MSFPSRAISIAVVLGSIAVIAYQVIARVDQPQRARFPAIDMHTHLGGVETWPGAKPNFGEILASMDARNVAVVVDFKAPDPGGEVYGERVTQRLEQYPDRRRFRLFANVPVSDANRLFLAESMADYRQWVAGILRDAVGRGASGLKLKFQGGGEGSWTYDSRGILVPLDSPQFDELWEEAARLGVPVLLHFSDGYKANHQPGGRSAFVRWEVLMYERERVLRRHPRMILVGAHWGCASQDVPYLADLLERFPNFYAEGAAHHEKDAFAILDAYRQNFLVTHQDKILFGTDYMEGTFGWLKSYLQRLDMKFPWTERWPLPDVVFEKFYGDNARKLFRLNAGNTPPVAHAGFAQTRVMGDLVTLDGTGSYDLDGSLLTHQWRQVGGPAVRLSSATSASPSFRATEEGQHVFELVVSDGKSSSASRRVMVNVMSRAGIFRETDGLVVIEAENFSKTQGRSGQGWTVAGAAAGFSGSGYVEAPGAGDVAVTAERARPALEYAVWIDRPGTYVVYARGQAVGGSGVGISVGLDRERVAFGEGLGGFGPGAWLWANETRRRNWETGDLDRHLAVLNIVEPGPHIINIWADTGRVRLDKLVLARHMRSETRFPLYDPGSGPGPAESSRTGAAKDRR